MRAKLTIRDYPIAEKRPELLEAEGGKAIADLNLEAVESGAVTMEDLRITPLALGLQAEIARDAGRPTLADNFERAAELVEVPQDFIMEVYELLRPGRAPSKAPLMDAARVLREVHGARRMAAFVEEAAEVYERRGLFRYRF